MCFIIMLTQEQLNKSIAIELDKNQVHLEYMRIRLDEDKELRKSLNWLLYLKNIITYASLPTLVEVCGQFGFDIEWIKMGIIAIVIVLIVCLSLLVINRNKLNQLLSKKDKEKYIDYIKQQSTYISRLESWLIRLDSHGRAQNVNGIELEYERAKATHDPFLEEVSELNGKLNEEWDKTAKELARQRLQKLKPYIYDSRSNS